MIIPICLENELYMKNIGGGGQSIFENCKNAPTLYNTLLIHLIKELIPGRYSVFIYAQRYEKKFHFKNFSPSDLGTVLDFFHYLFIFNKYEYL